MAKSNSSGITVSPRDVPTIIGMVARGDRRHDIAAWFGLNQGRVKETEDGKYGPPQAKAGSKLPPKGAPGPKGRHLRAAVNSALSRFAAGDTAGGITELQHGVGNYDADEV